MRYKFSFTAASLMATAMQALASMFRDCGSWAAVYERVIAENALQCRTESSLRRVGSELVARLGALSEEELARFAENRLGERDIFAWLASCRHYGMVGDFAIEVLHEAFVSGQTSLSHSDFDRFVNSKLAMHPELDEVSEQTYAKLRQVTFKMAAEAGFLDRARNIVPVVMERDLYGFLSERDLVFFPMFIGGR